MPPLDRTRSLRILVVEDNAVNRRLVEAFLEEAAHTPILVASGGDALAALDAETFDLVVMDVQMPEMDGFQLTAAIRAREASTGAHIPILAMTAHGSAEDRQRCLAAGMDGYIAKPARYEELIGLIESMALRETERRPVAGARAAFGRPGLREELNRQLVADAARLHGEMSEAIVRRDGAALQRAAHSLAGTAGFFMAHAVFALARRLEELGKAEDFGAQTERAAQELGEELARFAELPPPE